MKRCLVVYFVFLGLGAQVLAQEPGWQGMNLDAKELVPSQADPQQACLAKEPKVGRLVRAALARAGLDQAEDGQLRRQARLSGWLPKLDGGLSMDAGDRWYARYEPGEAMVEQQQQDDGLRWDVGLSWDLARMAYHGDDLQVAREVVKRAQQRRELAAEVIRLYFARRRLLIHGLPKVDSPARQQLEEFTALLDAWTGGRYARHWCGRKMS